MRRLVLSALLYTALACAQVTAITNVTVIDPGTSSVRPNMTVVVEGGQIRGVQPASTPLPGRARRIDARGKYLIPGLQDSHVHLTKAGVSSLPLFIANGVTSVRDLGSDLAEVTAWRKRIESGDLIGPRITTSGQILESSANVARMKKEATVEPVERIRMPVSNPDEARQAVRLLKAGGANHIKMRTTPDKPTFRAAAAEARRLGLRFALHSVASVEEMIDAEVGSIEHFIYYPPLNTMSAEDRRAMFQRLAKAGVFVSTTLSNVDGSIAIPYAEAKRRMEDRSGKVDRRRKYVCGYLVEDWREQVEERKDGVYNDFLKTAPDLYRDLREAREAGVLLIAGTDIGVVFMYAGFSLHDELGYLVRYTASVPMDALRSATYNAAAFHGAENQRGSIAAGQVADLVLLDADPISDIRNTTRIRGVMARGRWFDRHALDGLLQQVERGCRE